MRLTPGNAGLPSAHFSLSESRSPHFKYRPPRIHERQFQSGCGTAILAADCTPPCPLGRAVPYPNVEPDTTGFSVRVEIRCEGDRLEGWRIYATRGLGFLFLISSRINNSAAILDFKKTVDFSTVYTLVYTSPVSSFAV